MKRVALSKTLSWDCGSIDRRERERFEEVLNSTCSAR